MSEGPWTVLRQRWRCFTPQLQLLSPRPPPQCPKLTSSHTSEPACQDIQLQWLIPRLCTNSNKTWKWGSQQGLQGMWGLKSIINKWLLCFCFAARWLRFALKKQVCCKPLLAGPVNAFAPARSPKGKPISAKMTPGLFVLISSADETRCRQECFLTQLKGWVLGQRPTARKGSTAIGRARNWNLKGINGAQSMSSTAISTRQPRLSCNQHRLPPLAEQTFANLSSKFGCLAFLTAGWKVRLHFGWQFQQRKAGWL